MASASVRRSPTFPLLALATVMLIATSQMQWGIMRVAALVAWMPRHVELLMAMLALGGLAACGPLVRHFPAVDPPRPEYNRTCRIGVVGWALVGLAFVAPLGGWLVGTLFSVPSREPGYEPAGRSVAETVLDGVVVPALWEEFVWRVLVLAVLVRIVGPRLAIGLQAVSFAVAHSSWSVGFGQVPHSVASEYLLDAAVEVAVSGVVVGFLVLELASVWPAVVAHAVGNLAPTFRDAVPWLSFLATFAELAVGFVAWALMRRVALVRLRAWLRPAWRSSMIQRA